MNKSPNNTEDNTITWQGHHWYYDSQTSMLRRIDNNKITVTIDQVEDAMNHMEIILLHDLILQSPMHISS